MATLYKTDFYAWTQEQAEALRRMAAERANTKLDLENLAEEIDSMGRSDRRELRSRIARIIEHLYQLGESTLVDPRRGWENSVNAERESLDETLRDSPSLRVARHEELADAYALARRRLDRVYVELSMDKPPVVCPYDLDAHILHPDWLPEPRYR